MIQGSKFFSHWPPWPLNILGRGIHRVNLALHPVPMFSPTYITMSPAMSPPTASSLHRHPPMPSCPTQICSPLLESTRSFVAAFVSICSKGSRNKLDLLQVEPAGYGDAIDWPQLREAAPESRDASKILTDHFQPQRSWCVSGYRGWSWTFFHQAPMPGVQLQQ
jgi:hypothetical protein